LLYDISEDLPVILIIIIYLQKLQTVSNTEFGEGKINFQKLNYAAVKEGYQFKISNRFAVFENWDMVVVVVVVIMIMMIWTDIRRAWENIGQKIRYPTTDNLG
jgi:hypothetical protein